MRVGLVARGEDRGLGIQTWEFYRHMRPDRTLLVHMGHLAGGFHMHADRYPDATVVDYDGALPEDQVRAWLAGLDVVYTAETAYDWRLLDWAREAGVATVVHCNPEFYVHGLGRDPHPTVWWVPTPWRVAQLPAGTRVVPVPVAGDRFALRPAERDGTLRLLHVVGHAAAGDRNGTNQLLMALRMVHQPMRVRLATQGTHVPQVRLGEHVELTIERGGRPDYWDLYTDADALVMPRRYGGLCLPVQEAMAAGLAVTMTDTSPNSWWPARLVRGRPRGTLRAIPGQLTMWAAHPPALAAVLDTWASDPDVLAADQAAAVAWAQAHTWDALGQLYRDELAYAVGLCR